MFKNNGLFLDKFKKIDISSFLVSIPITLFTLTQIYLYKDSYLILVSDKFLDRGIIPPITLYLFYSCIIECMSILISSKIKMIRLNKNPSIFIADLNALKLNNINDKAIDIYLSQLYSHHYRKFQLPHFINWSIPILGFIGTVLGISLSSESIQQIMSSNGDVQNITQGISQAIAPLGIAFDTTLIALSLGIISTFFTIISSNSEDAFISQLEIELSNKKYE
ncbi:MotA/TolQ/ExbB proton channel family protein [Aliivibrio finisterrensis]|nr:MotA/TolQ/ExbB proton channel family protein [Aliivibrio finisterrensis]